MEVNDYVRYKTLSNQIKINKIKNIVEPDDSELSMTNIILYDLDNKDVTADKYIIKSSPNIIDLIEVGDYVNNEKIVDIGCLTNGPEEGTKVIDYYIAPNTVYYFKNEEIKTIVTREMFESMEYKVKE